MAFDGITTNCIKQEFQERLLEGRIDKIYQPSSTEILLHLRKNRENLKLLLSAHPVYSRVCITQKTFENPKNPPLFCMVLRKHLEGGRITGIVQPSFERILEIHIESRTELGDIARLALVIEVMGKHSNIMLLNQETKNIIDSVKRVPFSTSQYRQVLPGLEYILPPQQDKLNISDLSLETFTDKLLSQELTLPIEKALLNTIKGLSPSLAKQLTTSVGLAGQHLEFFGEYELNLIWQSVDSLKHTVTANTYKPVIFTDNTGQYSGFSPIDIGAVVGDDRSSVVSHQSSIVGDLSEYHNNSVIRFESMSEAVDNYYNWSLKNSSFMSVKSNLQNTINKEIKRCEKKLGLQLETVQGSKNSLQDKILGELLTANMYKIKKGMEEIQVEDYYNDNAPVCIKLQPELTPADNAQRYYKRYNKAKNAANKAAVQAEQSKEELAYLESLSFWLSETNSHEDFFQIEQELTDAGYLKPKNKPGKKTEAADKTKPIPNTYITKSGLKILVGKNNKQNDWVTFKAAKDDDLWFHAKGIPGSHVILKLEGKEASDEEIEAAALLAAFHSKGKFSAKLPVDFTQVKNVKKIKGAKPGLVTYENFKTIFITPDKELIDALVTHSQPSNS